MKTKVIFLLWMISSFITFGQNQKLMEEISCTPPKFTGIKSAVPMLTEEKFPTIESYLAENAGYPVVAIQRRDQGTEVVHFMVMPNGEIAEIQIINSVSREIDDEVIKTLIATNGMWIPGHNNEKPVAMEKEVSVVFRIGEMSNNDFVYNDFNYLSKKYFSHGAEMLFAKERPKKALKYFDKGIILLPNETAMLALRGLTRFELGDKEGALHDWTRIKRLGGLEGVGYIENFLEMKGYAEMMRVTAK